MTIKGHHHLVDIDGDTLLPRNRCIVLLVGEERHGDDWHSCTKDHYSVINKHYSIELGSSNLLGGKQSRMA